MQHLQSHIVQAMPLRTYLARSRNQIGAFVSELDEEGRSDQHVVLRFDLSPDRELVELLAVDLLASISGIGTRMLSQARGLAFLMATAAL